MSQFITLLKSANHLWLIGFNTWRYVTSKMEHLMKNLIHFLHSPDIVHLILFEICKGCFCVINFVLIWLVNMQFYTVQHF